MTGSEWVVNGTQGDSMQLSLKGWARKAAALAMILGFAAAIEVTPAAFAQTSVTGSINGVVTDSTGAVVPGAAVTLKDEANGAVINLTTNADGRFTAPFLKPDIFDLTATSPGLQSTTTTVQVLTGQQSAATLTVTPTASSQTVQVSANNAQLIDTQTANTTTTFTTQQFQNLPAPGGDITTIAFTIPGVVVGAGTQGFGEIVSDGLPGLSNLVVVNGADYSSSLYGGVNFSGSSNLTLGQQEIAQASVVQNGYSTQYGRQAGLIETYTTKSGANRLHGLLQYDYNSAGLNANDFFNNLAGVGKPKAVSNQYAAQIGGPIKHDKLFFFVDTEGIRYVQASTGFVNFPSPALQASVAANPNITADSKALYAAMFAGSNASPAFAGATPVVTGPGVLQDSSGTYGCGTGPAAGGTGLAGTPDYASGGTLGTSASESCINAAFVNSAGANREWLAAGRIDWNISPKQRIFFRVTDDQGFQPSFVSLINSAYDQVSNQPAYTGQLNDTYSVTPNMTNQFIAAALYYSGIFAPANTAAGLAASPAEFDQAANGGTNQTPGVGQPTFFTNSTTLGSPWIDFPGGVNILQYQVTDGLSWLKGNHNFRFGFDFRRIDDTDVSLETASLAGDFAFGSIADEFGGVLPGAAGSSFTRDYPALGNIHNAAYNVGIYAQDEWRATPNLVLDYGIRVDRTGNPICTDSCYTHYVGGFPDTSATLDTPYNATLSAGHDSAYPAIEKAVIQPRAGFNWDTRGNGKTVLRGGIGLFSDGAPGLIAEQQFESFPNQYSAQVQTGTIGLGAGSAQAVAASSAAAVLAGFSQGATYNTINTVVLGETGSPFPAPNYTTSPQTFHSARYLEYSLQLQKQITPTDAVILSYAGNHGYDLFIVNDHLNQEVGTSLYGSYGSGTFDDLPANSIDPRFGIVKTFTNNAISNYNGISVEYKHIDRRGLNADFSYTYSHSLDDISNGGNNQLPYNNNTALASEQITADGPSRLNYSNSDYDIRHNFVMDLTYVEPNHFTNKLVDFVAAGWTVGAKAYWRSGEPFSIVNSNAENALFTGTGGTTVLAQVLNNNFNHHCNSFSSPCLQNFGDFNGTGPGTSPTLPGTTTPLVQPVQTNFGNVSRNSIYGPHYSDVDVNLYKDLFHKGSMAFQVGAQAYNVLNHVSFGQPNGDASNLSSLGKISSDVSPPTSPYGSAQGSVVAGRVLVVQGRLLF
jgi:hypothetical protein